MEINDGKVQLKAQGPRKKDYAIIHSIGCINPYECHKNNRRELKLIKNCDIRQNLWNSYATIIKCPKRFALKEYSSVLLSV